LSVLPSAAVSPSRWSLFAVNIPHRGQEPRCKTRAGGGEVKSGPAAEDLRGAGVPTAWRRKGPRAGA